jgi:hypothetical protein
VGEGSGLLHCFCGGGGLENVLINYSNGNTVIIYNFKSINKLQYMIRVSLNLREVTLSKTFCKELVCIYFEDKVCGGSYVVNLYVVGNIFPSYVVDLYYDDVCDIYSHEVTIKQFLCTV